MFHGSSIALFQLETPIPTVAAALKMARAEGLRTILDPHRAQALPPEMIRNVDILTPNEAEALMLLGRDPGISKFRTPPTSRANWRSSGAPMIALKLGRWGCYFHGAGEEGHVPGFAVETLDSTAAGDTFNAGLAIALAEGASMQHALRFANAAAAISVTRAGAQASRRPARKSTASWLTSDAVPFAGMRQRAVAIGIFWVALLALLAARAPGFLHRAIFAKSLSRTLPPWWSQSA